MRADPSRINMVSEKTMAIILAYSVPYINENLKSIDFLNNKVQKVDGKTPFYDTETIPAERAKGIARKNPRSPIHMKDQWRVDVSAKGDVGYVYLTNAKKTADGKWIVADLLWYGTGPYQISVPTTFKQVMVSAVPGVGQTQYPSLKQWRRYRQPEPLVRGHETGAMFFYNRYTGHFNYNRTSRLGIRDILVRSFKEYLLLCVENGIRRSCEMLERENILNVHIQDVHVRVAK